MDSSPPASHTTSNSPDSAVKLPVSPLAENLPDFTFGPGIGPGTLAGMASDSTPIIPTNLIQAVSPETRENRPELSQSLLRLRLLPAGRAMGTLLLLGPAIAIFCWLVLTSADFLGTVRVGRGLTRPWADFALLVSLGIVLPPALIAGLDARHPWLLRLQEASRASLITFFLFAMAFFLTGSLLARFASGMSVGLIPELLRRIGPVLLCSLLYISYKLVASMLPLPKQTAPPPFSICFFVMPAIFLILTLPLQALAPLSPLGLPPLPVSFYDVRALPQDIFLFASMAWLLRNRGQRVFRPVWVGICVLGPLLILPEMTIYPLPWQIFHLARALAAIISCVCLYTPSTRRWLVA